jgi:hypothetical protein
METRQVMPQAYVFALYPCHVCFTDKMVGIINKAGVDSIVICDVPEALPTA